MRREKSIRVLPYILVFIFGFWIFSLSASAESVPITITGYFDYQKVQDVLIYTNEIRQKAGAPELALDAELTEMAMQRAAEIQLIFDHYRPDGTFFNTVSDRAAGENITAGEFTAKDAVEDWRKSKDHYRNMINASYTSIGIGCFYQNGVPYWVQLFGDGQAVSGELPQNGVKKKAAIQMRSDWFNLYTNILCSEEATEDNLSATSLERGAASNIWLGFYSEIADKETFLSVDTVKNYPVIDMDGFRLSSSDPDILSCSGTIINANRKGTVNLVVEHSADPTVRISKIFTVTDKAGRMVKFNANGGTVGKDSSAKTKSIWFSNKKAYGTLPVPARKGYSFSGWYTKKSGGTKIKASSKVNIASGNTQTLYAHWKKISVSKASVSKASSKSSGKLTVTWRKISGASGYEVSVSTSKNFTSKTTQKTTIKGASKKSCSFYNLKKGKKYYVRVRAYKTDSADKKVYGKYSAVKTVNVHK